MTQHNTWRPIISGDHTTPTLCMTNNGILKVCICGEHKEGYLPLKEFGNVKVILHYVDKNGEVQLWKGNK